MEEALEIKHCWLQACGRCWMDTLLAASLWTLLSTVTIFVAAIVVCLYTRCSSTWGHLHMHQHYPNRLDANRLTATWQRQHLLGKQWLRPGAIQARQHLLAKQSAPTILLLANLGQWALAIPIRSLGMALAILAESLAA